jgi:hypothetical protein
MVEALVVGVVLVLVMSTWLLWRLADSLQARK